jgi:hypothetical protein
MILEIMAFVIIGITLLYAIRECFSKEDLIGIGKILVLCVLGLISIIGLFYIGVLIEDSGFGFFGWIVIILLCCLVCSINPNFYKEIWRGIIYMGAFVLWFNLIFYGNDSGWMLLISIVGFIFILVVGESICKRLE